ncbi:MULTISPECIES: hypothetical protein [Kaistella]|uniref:Uncharacterized protein n=1 Tax=Kaistella chaponensis TaxID=713588 RepID=A0A1N7NCJ8_9FLAO|nr:MULTISPECIES: hypothetical protein [Kaistella]SIS96123.1 hypothetical protein SAMN05421789_11370 [Kaistella chaponensis]
MTNLFPKENEIVTLKNEYKILLKTLFSTINIIEEKNTDDNRWFVFSEKVARKFLNQAHSIDLLFSNGIFINEERLIDFSSLFSLLRNQFENYAVFYHLFVDRKCEMEEKILRFRLWELDAIKSRQNYKRDNEFKVDRDLQLEKEKLECIEIIKIIPLYKNLTERNQNYLINSACWKFTSESLQNKDSNKKKISINQIIMNTGIKENTFKDWYSYSSTHIHTSYWSVIQNNSLTDREKAVAEYLAVTQANLLTAFLINDLHKIYKVGNEGFAGLPQSVQNIVQEYQTQFKNT